MIHAQAPKHWLEKWFNCLIGLFCTDGRTPSPEIMSHFSSLCLGVDQYKIVPHTLIYKKENVFFFQNLFSLFCFSMVIPWRDTRRLIEIYLPGKKRKHKTCAGSSMIPSARPTVPAVAINVLTRNLLCFVRWHFNQIDKRKTSLAKLKMIHQAMSWALNRFFISRHTDTLRINNDSLHTWGQFDQFFLAKFWTGITLFIQQK